MSLYSCLPVLRYENAGYSILSGAKNPHFSITRSKDIHSDESVFLQMVLGLDVMHK
jgi:hypothetical protein